MEDFNSQQSSDDVKQLMEQLRAENVALRDENTALRDENTALQQQCVTLGQQLATAESERSHAQAELSTLTDAAQVLQEDREQLRNKIAELQAAVDRLTNILWGRRSEKRSNSENQPTLFDLQLTDEELTAQQKEILAAEDLLSDAAKQKLLDELLQRRKKRQLKRLEQCGREEFPEHIERRHITLDLDDEAIGNRQTHLAAQITVQVAPKRLRTLAHIYNPMNMVGTRHQARRPFLTPVLNDKTPHPGQASGGLSLVDEGGGNFVAVRTQSTRHGHSRLADQGAAHEEERQDTDDPPFLACHQVARLVAAGLAQHIAPARQVRRQTSGRAAHVGVPVDSCVVGEFADGGHGRSPKRSHKGPKRKSVTRRRSFRSRLRRPW